MVVGGLFLFVVGDVFDLLVVVYEGVVGDVIVF